LTRKPPLTTTNLKSGKTKATTKNRRPVSENPSQPQGEFQTTTTDNTSAALSPSANTATSSPEEDPSTNNLFLGQQNTVTGFGGNGMYGGAGGYGMMMGGSPYMSSFGYGGGMMPGVMPGQPFSGLNQFLFGIQSVIFSLGQAVQIMGMNTQAVHQLLDTATTMFDHALGTWKEMRALEANVNKAVEESEEEKKKRRRLKALRWAMTLGVAYAAYKIIRRLLFHKRQQQRNLLTATAYQSGTSNMPQQQQQQQQYHDNNNPYDAGQSYPSNNYGTSSALMSPNYYNNYNSLGGVGQYPTNSNNMMYGPQQQPNYNGMGYY